MARAEFDPDEVEERELPPPTRGGGGKWLPLLTQLLKRKGRWHMVQTFDSPEEALNARKNLALGKVRIPEPMHDWGFASRGCELYAIYRGPKRPPVKGRRKGHEPGRRRTK